MKALAISIVLALCLTAANSYCKPEIDKYQKLLQKISCNELVDTFQALLDDRANEVISNQDGQDPKAIQIKPTITLLKCISPTSIEISVATYIKTEVQDKKKTNVCYSIVKIFQVTRDGDYATLKELKDPTTTVVKCEKS